MVEESGYYTSSTQTSTLAIISFIAGFFGLSLFPGVGSIVAVILGPLAKKEIDRSGGTLSGEKIAQIGILLGWIGLILSFLGICFAIGLMGCGFILLFSGRTITEMGGLHPLFTL
jgi:hypothetical protein